ncbi:MAG: hypothetical protein KDJ77_12710, partial [Rhodobiaceae bacterium]|nr:hypothetical protein [Rhodobiaceae bacterium]
MKTAFTALALVGLMLMLAPAAADPITELQPFLGEGKIISGNKTGDGVYDGITFGENGEKGSAERLSIEMDGNNLTNLTMEQVVILDPDGTKGTIGRIVVDNSSIPLNLDKEDPKAFFAWILSLNADRLAIEDLNVGSKDSTVTIGTVAAENVRNGYFDELKIENLAVDGTSDEGVPFTVTIDKASMRGVGAAWMLYMRSMALEQASTSSANMSSNLSGEDFAFLDDFKLADHVDQLRLKGFTFSGLKVVSNGADLFNLDSYTGHITDYSGAFPVAGEYTLSGSVNVETIRGLSESNPQAQMGLQMFQAAYGDPVVNFSGSGEQSYSKETRTMVSRMKIIELDRLMKINLYTVFDNYDPADFIEALYDPNDDKTMV